jgi:hypothetical protein
VRGRELAVLTDGPLGPADAGGVDQCSQRAEVRCGLDRVDDLVGLGDVDGDEYAADFVGEGFSLVGLKIGYDDPGSLCGLLTGSRCADP